MGYFGGGTKKGHQNTEEQDAAEAKRKAKKERKEALMEKRGGHRVKYTH